MFTRMLLRTRDLILHYLITTHINYSQVAWNVVAGMFALCFIELIGLMPGMIANDLFKFNGSAHVDWAITIE